jgi:hypothetical protein
MVFPAPKYPCGVCAERREETDFHTIQKRITIASSLPSPDDEVRQVSVRYCRDKGVCQQKAPKVLAQKVKDMVERGY